MDRSPRTERSPAEVPLSCWSFAGSKRESALPGDRMGNGPQAPGASSPVPHGANGSLPERIVAFDLETTGLDPSEHRIVEFAFIVLDRELEELDRWHEVVDPGRPIPEPASEVHGITDADVADAPSFAQLGPVVQAIVDDAILMAYNHEFDREFLHAELCRVGGYGVAEKAPFIDPLPLFKRHVPETPNKLEAAVEHYLGTSLEGAHRAVHDTAAMVDVFRAMQRVHPEIDGRIEEAIVEHRDWIDEDRKLYRDEKGLVCFGFGKHEGEPVIDHDAYAEWMLDADFAEDTKAKLRQALAR